MKGRRQKLEDIQQPGRPESRAVDSLQEAPSNHQQGISKALQSLWTASSENNALYLGRGRGTSLQEASPQHRSSLGA